MEAGGRLHLLAPNRYVVDWVNQNCASRIGELVDELVPVPVDDLVRRHHIPYQEAETIGPALLAYEHLARAFHVKQILVAAASMRAVSGEAFPISVSISLGGR